MDGKREQYREEQRRPFLRARLECPGKPPLEGRVVDLSSGGAGLVVEEGQAPLHRGALVQLVFETLVLLKPIRISALVARAEDHEGGVRYGLEFTDPAELDRQVPFVLRKEFNRRSAARGKPKDLVEVVLESPGGASQVRARMVDLSTGGTGLSMQAIDEDTFGDGTRVIVSFVLPGQTSQLRLAARVRGRRARGQGLLLHLQFDPRATDDYEWQRSLLEEYVTERLLRSCEVRRS